MRRLHIESLESKEMLTGMAPEPGDNLGQLTQYVIQELDWDQGGHSSDPSGDGLGREDRVGLANIFGRGDLQSTVDFLADAFGV